VTGGDETGFGPGSTGGVVGLVDGDGVVVGPCDVPGTGLAVTLRAGVREPDDV
jgi:hypothetical protein